MNIERTDNGTAVTLKLTGCLDTTAAADFGTALQEALTAKTLTIDFTDLDFIASSAIRLLVSANKKASAQGHTITLIGMNDVVADVFEVTGLNEVFDIR